jgi:hypothetical protein
VATPGTGEPPSRALPPITSSELKTRTFDNVGAIARTASVTAGRLPPTGSSPIVEERTTLGALSRRISEQVVDEAEAQPFDPGDFLRRNTPSVQRSGASLAAAALNLRKRR